MNFKWIYAYWNEKIIKIRVFFDKNILLYKLIQYFCIFVKLFKKINLSLFYC